MRIREWIAENIGYRFFGCLYNKSHDHIFDFIQTKIPKDLLHRKIYDLGCGDGGNTVRVQKVFQAKEIVGYDHNDFLLKRAKKKGILVKKFDFNLTLPKGEMAAFIFSLHHASDKEKTLKEAVKNFKYIFICEPCLDLYHWLFDGGEPLPKEKWIELFDKILKKYLIYQYKNNLIVFYKKTKEYRRFFS